VVARAMASPMDESPNAAGAIASPMDESPNAISIMRALGALTARGKTVPAFVELAGRGAAELVPVLFALDVAHMRVRNLTGLEAVPWQRILLDAAVWIAKVAAISSTDDHAALLAGILRLLEASINAGLFVVHHGGTRRDVLLTTQAVALMHRVVSLTPGADATVEALAAVYRVLERKFGAKLELGEMLQGFCQCEVHGTSFSLAHRALFLPVDKRTRLPAVQIRLVNIASVLAMAMMPENEMIGQCDLLQEMMSCCSAETAQPVVNVARKRLRAVEEEFAADGGGDSALAKICKLARVEWEESESSKDQAVAVE